jgi:small subunit ribosomal protein S1
LADHKVESPEDVVKVGDEIEVKVLRVDAADRKLGLSRKRLNQPDEIGEEEGEEASAERGKARERELRGGTGSSSAPLFSMPENKPEE